jgi:hypothetical protein
MDLSREEKQACAYLFQRSKNIEVMGEKLVKAGEFSATREDLMCLQPGRSITDLVIYFTNAFTLLMKYFLKKVNDLKNVIFY